jgi:hypothetical protein
MSTRYSLILILSEVHRLFYTKDVNFNKFVKHRSSLKLSLYFGRHQLQTLLQCVR